MITFQEFIDKTNIIVEGYYAPNEPLPGSGRTPLQKAQAQQERPLSSDRRAARGRRIRHKREVEYSVKRGSENPTFDLRPHPDIHITSYRRGGEDYEIYHKPTGIKYHVSKHPDSKKNMYSIAWTHSHRGRSMSDKTARHITRNAIRVGRDVVIPRLPYGSTAHNSPTPSFKERGEDYIETNPRAGMYQFLGFGPVNADGDQYAKVGRNPSPRQRARRRTRLSPLEGNN